MKKERYSSKKRRSKKRASINPLVLLLVTLGGIVLVLWSGYALWEASQGAQGKVPIQVTGSPSLQVDREIVDLGDVPVNQTVTVSFQLSNVGDKTLRFSTNPYIVLMEGC